MDKCDKRCYGANLNLPKGHPDRQEMCPLAEFCEDNPDRYKEFLNTVLTAPLSIFLKLFK